MLTNVPFSIEPETIIRQTKPSAKFQLELQPEQVKDLLDFWFKSATYAEDPYDLSKEFNIVDLYRDRIELRNYIRAFAVVNKFNLEHVLSNEYKIAVRCKGHKCSWQIYATRCEASFNAHTNYLRATLRKFVIISDRDPGIINAIPKMTSYGRTDSVNIKDGTCSYHWWQTMGIPCEHGVRALGLANADPTTRVSEYYKNNTYKVAYETIWIPIRGIEQWKLLKTDPRVRAPIPIV
ncbi:hypothetical protein GIB67_005283 [Kingdonia uniflora]|uniref:SWIM-type domain-containing protein n=1 Tax=Kingdonia uniflora TaxID=39325 RepID=A0A7J7L845_9MAGN|nr:hypothetical protein GIB67_005283 [Kingdonia uniflora]